METPETKHFGNKHSGARPCIMCMQQQDVHLEASLLMVLEAQSSFESKRLARGPQSLYFFQSGPSSGANSLQGASAEVKPRAGASQKGLKRTLKRPFSSFWGPFGGCFSL